MNRELIDTQVRDLAQVWPTDSPVVSVYLDLDRPEAERRLEHAGRRAIARAGDDAASAAAVAALAPRGVAHLRDRVPAGTRGLAWFARAGVQAFERAIHLPVPVGDRVAVGEAPEVFPLVELKDTWRDFLVLISRPDSARILEVELGAVRADLRSAAPAAPEFESRVVFQVLRRDRKLRFVEEKTELITRMMRAGGMRHRLVLVGSAETLPHVRRRLPADVQARLVELSEDAATPVPDLVRQAMQAVAEEDRLEVEDATRRLSRLAGRGRLAALGRPETLAALHEGRAERVILTRGDPAREEVARVALRARCPVEVVDAPLADGVGVGCLLRRAPVDY